MPEDSLATLGETIRDQFAHQMTALGAGWLDDPFPSTDWEPLRALEMDYLHLLQPVLEWLTLERWLTSGFLPETLTGETSAREDAPTNWDTVFERLPGPDNVHQNVHNTQYPISNPQSTDQLITDHQSPTTDHQSPITDHQSPITDHPSPPTPFSSTSDISPLSTGDFAAHSLTEIRHIPRSSESQQKDQGVASEFPITHYELSTPNPPTSPQNEPPSAFVGSASAPDHPIPVPKPLSEAEIPASNQIPPTQAPDYAESLTPPLRQETPNHRSPITDHHSTPNPPIPQSPIPNTQSLPPPFTSTYERLLSNSETSITNYELPNPDHPPSPIPDHRSPITDLQSPISNTEYPISNNPLRPLHSLAHAFTESGGEEWSDEWEEDEQGALAAPHPGQEADREPPPAHTGNGKDRRFTPREVSYPDRKRQPVRLPSSDNEPEMRQELPPRPAPSASYDAPDAPAPPVDLDEIYEALVEEVKREYRRFYGI